MVSQMVAGTQVLETRACGAVSRRQNRSLIATLFATCQKQVLCAPKSPRSFETASASPVYYMSPTNQAPKTA